MSFLTVFESVKKTAATLSPSDVPMIQALALAHGATVDAAHDYDPTSPIDVEVSAATVTTAMVIAAYESVDPHMRASYMDAMTSFHDFVHDLYDRVLVVAMSDDSSTV